VRPQNFAGGGPPGGEVNGDERRQLANEMRQRLNDAEALRRDLAQQGADVSALDRAIDALRKSIDAAHPDSEADATLRQQVIEGLKAYEFAMRRLAADSASRVLTGRQGDVPPAFRAYVEEYYRAIARPKTPPSP
jgi:hypothetical protein